MFFYFCVLFEPKFTPEMLWREVFSSFNIAHFGSIAILRKVEAKYVCYRKKFNSIYVTQIRSNR
jgi:hypothetical protein